MAKRERDSISKRFAGVSENQVPAMATLITVECGPDSFKILFTLSDDPVDLPLRKAFAEKRLNPENPAHWVILLRIFAYAHFGGKPRGAQLKWDTARLETLLNDFHKIKKPHLSDESVFVLLGKLLPEYQHDDGKPLSANRLRALREKALGLIQHRERPGLHRNPAEDHYRIPMFERQVERLAA